MNQNSALSVFRDKIEMIARHKVVLLSVAIVSHAFPRGVNRALDLLKLLAFYSAKSHAIHILTSSKIILYTAVLCALALVALHTRMHGLLRAYF